MQPTKQQLDRHEDYYAKFTERLHSSQTATSTCRLAAFKLLVNLLYSRRPFLRLIGTRQLELDTGPAARSFHFSSGRLTGQLKWLNEHGYITDLQLEYGKATFKLNMPLNLR